MFVTLKCIQDGGYEDAGIEPVAVFTTRGFAQTCAIRRTLAYRRTINPKDPPADSVTFAVGEIVKLKRITGDRIEDVREVAMENPNPIYEPIPC